MGIPVTCPKGHHFKVKDKYAGKKGLCPHCSGQVVVTVPDALSPSEAEHRRLVADEIRHTQGAAAAAAAAADSSVLDDSLEASASSSSSLLGSSVIRHNVKCSCGHAVPMWFAKCPTCGKFLERR